MIYQKMLNVVTQTQGLFEITDLVTAVVERSDIVSGVITVFCQHTSCSLLIMENADETARYDLEKWMNRLVLENDSHFVHTLEEPDDMPSHIKMALTRTSETVPIRDGRMLLGTWQGIYLWEHRRAPHNRTLIITVIGE